MGSGAQQLVDGLRRLDVEVVFGLPGVHNMPAWHALEAAPDIALVCVRHEQTAAYAADGYARASGRLGVALVTTGPGAANTLAAVGEAHACGSPILVIATATPAALRVEGVNRGALHETPDQLDLFAPLTKWRLRAERDIALAVRVAGEEALTAPRGPVYLELPTDVLAAEPVAGGGLHMIRPDGPSSGDPAPLLAAAERPLIWAGGGAVDMGAEVAALAERLGAPILTTFGARGIAAESPRLVRLPPHAPEAGALWDEADLVIAIGSDLDGVDTQNWRQPQPPRLIAVNLDADDAQKNYRVDAIVPSIDPLGEIEQRAPWADEAAVSAAGRARLRAELPAEFAFLDAVAAATPDDAVIVCDMCIPGYWLAGFHEPPAPRRLQVPLGWGTLGYAFPAAIGVAQAARRTLAVCGDGGFLFAAGELATVAQEQPDLTILVVDDGGYGMLETPLDGVPDFVALAAAFGIAGERAEELEPVLDRHLEAPGPSLIHWRAALSPPPTTSPRWYRA